ncbi:MAG: ABC transporter permease subunit [Phycicoccus sp.]
MMWLTWRQHRAQWLATAVILMACAVYLLPAGNAMRVAVDGGNLADCLGDSPGVGCAERLHGFWMRFEGSQNLVATANLLPVLVGVFFGAPLLAREFEHGTWRLVWTQGVTRSRWLTVKLVVVGTSVVVVGLGFSGLLSWWRAPLNEISSRFAPTAFNFEGVVPVAVCVFAFAVGALAGAVTRHTLAAMGSTVIAFLAVRLAVETVARPSYRDPLVRTIDADSPRDVLDSKDWVVGGDSTTELFHPAERFWQFQLIESGIYLALSAALLVLTLAVIRRRTA